MGETLNLLFRNLEDGTFELQARENWSGRTVSGSFVPPYTSRQLNALQKKLNKFNNNINDLHEIGYRLFLALCGSETPGTSRRELSEHSVQAMQRALAGLIENGTILLDKKEQVTYDDLVGYLSSLGGAGLLDDNETVLPCYVVHFDGHGAFGRLCPDEDCQKLNDADASKCLD